MRSWGFPIVSATILTLILLLSQKTYNIKGRGLHRADAAGGAGGQESQCNYGDERGLCDVTNNENFIYPPGEEPLKNFNRIKTGENCISDHIVVPNYGAGTANTELM